MFLKRCFKRSRTQKACLKEISSGLNEMFQGKEKFINQGGDSAIMLVPLFPTTAPVPSWIDAFIRGPSPTTQEDERDYMEVNRPN